MPRSPRVRYTLTCAVLLLSLFAVGGDARAHDGAVIWIRPTAGNYQAGETFAVNVGIDNVAGLYGADVRVAFDPARLQIVETSVTPQTGLLSPPWMILFNLVDNQAGTVVYVLTMLNPQVPVSGSGALFSFHFRALAPGPATVTISEQILTSIDGEEIPATTTGAVYQVGQQANRVFLPVVLRMGLVDMQAKGAAGGSFWHDALESDWR